MTHNEQRSAETEATDTSAWRRLTAAVRRVPLSTYRLQLSAAFDLNAAAGTLPYLRQLGMTDCYTSPYFTAGRNSPSGYDVCDHNTIQPELGGEPAFARFAAALNAERLGLVADAVPNHMGLDESRNGWWRDVLARGRRSPCAGYFDIDWQPAKIELRDKILLPILDKPYGVALAAGDIRIISDGDTWVVAYADRRLPIDGNATAINGDPRVLESADVHRILEQQVYRLAYWRTASDEINYRRFFDVDGLIGIRVELPVVFDAAHARLRALIAEGVVTSLRIDHPDGLADPDAYLQRLQDVVTADGGTGIHVVAEKILVDGEQLPGRWRAHGTTGYDFLCRLNALFVPRDGRAALTRAYGRLCGSQPGWREETYQSRVLVMNTTLASEVQMLASAFNRISERDPRSRDFTLNSLRLALVEFLAALPVYRTYLTSGSGSPAHGDVEHITAAAFAASRRVRGLERSVFQFLLAVLSEDAAAASLGYPPVDDVDRAERQAVTRRLQQFSASVFAKGIEDTAMYRYHPLLSENEVGCGPAQTTRAATDFHAHNESRAADAPFGFLATATHDTKLGEDTRARINVIAEIPALWMDHVRQWRQVLRAYRTPTRLGWIPDPHDEYRLYQVLAGTWPFRLMAGADAAVGPAPACENYVHRISEYVLKAAREAKRQTSWINQDSDYEAGLTRFVAGALTGDSGARFHAHSAELFTRIARAGVVNSLAQVALKLTSPGIADIYQGCELWDLTLVDPDNRRPVDFAHRAVMLEGLEPLIASAAQGPIVDDMQRMLAEWPTGRIKLYVTTQLLRLRRSRPSLFLEGHYVPLQPDEGPGGSVIAFVRRYGASGALVVVPRLVEAMMRGHGWPIGDVWQERQIEIPRLDNGGVLTNVLTGERLDLREPTRLGIASLLAHCPVGIWTWGVQPAAQQLGHAPGL